MCGCANPGRPFCQVDAYPLLVFFFNIRDTYTVWFPPFCTHSIFCALFCNLQNNILYNGMYLAEQHMLSGSHPFFSTALHPMDPSEENVVLHSRTSYASILVSYSLTSYGSIIGPCSITQQGIICIRPSYSITSFGPIIIVFHSRTSYGSILLSHSCPSCGSITVSLGQFNKSHTGYLCSLQNVISFLCYLSLKYCCCYLESFGVFSQVRCLYYTVPLFKVFSSFPIIGTVI